MLFPEAIKGAWSTRTHESQDRVSLVQTKHLQQQGWPNLNLTLTSLCFPEILWVSGFALPILRPSCFGSYHPGSTTCRLRQEGFIAEWGFQPLVTHSSTPSSVSSPSQGCGTQRVSLHLPPQWRWKAGAGKSSCAWVVGAMVRWCSWLHCTDMLQSRCSRLKWTRCVQQCSSHSLKHNEK